MAFRYARENLANPEGLLTALEALFPDFASAELATDVQSGDASLHSIMAEFSCSFDAGKANPVQIAGLASLMTQCVAVADDLENAAGTCFLEHLRQIDRRGLLWRSLAPDVRSYVRAH